MRRHSAEIVRTNNKSSLQPSAAWPRRGHLQAGYQGCSRVQLARQSGLTAMRAHPWRLIAVAHCNDETMKAAKRKTMHTRKARPDLVGIAGGDAHVGGGLACQRLAKPAVHRLVVRLVLRSNGAGGQTACSHRAATSKISADSRALPPDKPRRLHAVFLTGCMQ